MSRWLVVVMLLVGCAHAPAPRVAEERSYGLWTEEIRALVILVHGPRQYLTVPNAYPFILQVNLLEPNDLAWQHARRWRPIAEGTSGETLWERSLRLLTFLNTERFMGEGRIALRPIGYTMIENPLRDRCPSDLVEVGTADVDGANARVHEVVPAGRDEEYGCLYRIRTP